MAKLWVQISSQTARKAQSALARRAAACSVDAAGYTQDGDEQAVADCLARAHKFQSLADALHKARSASTDPIKLIPEEVALQARDALYVVGQTMLSQIFTRAIKNAEEIKNYTGERGFAHQPDAGRTTPMVRQAHWVKHKNFWTTWFDSLPVGSRIETTTHSVWQKSGENLWVSGPNQVTTQVLIQLANNFRLYS